MEGGREGGSVSECLSPGLNLKVLVVEVASGEVAKPVAFRAELSWTVLQLKESISEVYTYIMLTGYYNGSLSLSLTSPTPSLSEVWSLSEVYEVGSKSGDLRE